MPKGGVLMITFAEIAIGSGDSVLCESCARKAADGAKEPFGLDVVRAGLIDAAQSWSSGPGPNVTFTGFEPFAHPELPALIQVATDMGFRRVRLQTDAGALASPGNAEGALGAGVRQLEVLMLAEGDEHDRLTGRPGLFAAASKGVETFLSAARSAAIPVAVTGLVPVCRHNVASAPAAVAVLASLGAVAVHLAVTGLPSSEFVHILAALDTAAANSAAASVSGAAIDVPSPWHVRAWSSTGEATA